MFTFIYITHVHACRLCLNKWLGKSQEALYFNATRKTFPSSRLIFNNKGLKWHLWGLFALGSSVSFLAITPRELVCPVTLDIECLWSDWSEMRSLKKESGWWGHWTLEGKDRVTIDWQMISGKRTWEHAGHTGLTVGLLEAEGDVI